VKSGDQLRSAPCFSTGSDVDRNRRISNGEQFLLATASALAHPVSRQWKGYWQREA
jgi:hypothetical protein